MKVANIMRTLVIGLAAVSAGMTLAAEESLEAWDAYREALTARNVNGDEEAAQEALRRASRQIRDPGSELANKIKTDLMDSKNANALETLISKFLTGKKTEFYCRGVGLVEMKGEHNDGTSSHVVLKDNNRVLADDFARIQSGTWVYELSNGYRAASDSTLKVLKSDENIYIIEENRIKKQHDDFGQYTLVHKKNKKDQMSWHNTSSSNDGEVLEPTPKVFLATGFHMWGNESMGLNIDFREGFKDRFEVTLERSHGKVYIGDVSLLVSEHLPEVKTTDSKGKVREYQDCFKVDIDIVLKKIEDSN